MEILLVPRGSSVFGPDVSCSARGDSDKLVLPSSEVALMQQEQKNACIAAGDKQTVPVMPTISEVYEKLFEKWRKRDTTAASAPCTSSNKDTAC